MKRALDRDGTVNVVSKEAFFAWLALMISVATAAIAAGPVALARES